MRNVWLPLDDILTVQGLGSQQEDFESWHGRWVDSSSHRRREKCPVGLEFPDGSTKIVQAFVIRDYTDAGSEHQRRKDLEDSNVKAVRRVLQDAALGTHQEPVAVSLSAGEE